MRLTEESDVKSKTGDFLGWVCWRRGEFAGSGGDLGFAYMQECCCEKEGTNLLQPLEKCQTFLEAHFDLGSVESPW